MVRKTKVEVTLPRVAATKAEGVMNMLKAAMAASDDRPLSCRIGLALSLSPELPPGIDSMCCDCMTAFSSKKDDIESVLAPYIQRIRTELLEGEELHPASARKLPEYIYVGGLRVMVPEELEVFAEVDAAWRRMNPSVYAVA